MNKQVILLLIFSLALGSIFSAYPMENASQRNNVIQGLLYGNEKADSKFIQARESYWQWIKEHKYYEGVTSEEIIKHYTSWHYSIERELVEHLEENHLEVIPWLIALGADINCKYTVPLWTAARAGNESACRLLIAHGAPVNQKTETGHAPLWTAAKNGYFAVVELLIEHGALINEESYLGLPLQTAAIADYPDHKRPLAEYEKICRFLLARGANVNQRDQHNSTALHSAAWGGQCSIIKLLLEHHAEVNVLDEKNESPLHHAAKWGHYSACVLLLENGADPAIGSSALADAAYHGQLSTCKLLLNYNAPVNAQYQGESTALSGAVLRNDESICQLLLDHGADLFLCCTHMRDPRTPGYTGYTPLILAAKEKKMRICQMILNKAYELNRGIITFLLCLRKDHIQWYQQRCVLRPYLEPYSLNNLLEAKDRNGYTAYDYWNVEALMPYSMRAEK